MTIQNHSNKLKYLIDPTFTVVSRLLFFFYSFESIKKSNVKRGYRYSFSPYYVPNIEIKDFNVLIHGRSFFDLPVKDDKEAHEKIIEMRKNNDQQT